MSKRSINIIEIHSRLRREYNGLMAFDIPRLAYKYHERREKLKIKEYVTYANAYPVRSAAGNNWIIFIQKSPAVKKYINRNCISIRAVTYHYCDKGLRAFYLADNNVIVGFNPHFFERYNERMKLNLHHPLDIVKAFFKKGIYCHEGMIKNKSKKQPIAFRADGLQLGEYHVKDGYMEWRTFVSRDLTFRDQHKIAMQLKKQHKDAINHIPALQIYPAIPYK
jgi:hypothetical protein